MIDFSTTIPSPPPSSAHNCYNTFLSKDTSVFRMSSAFGAKIIIFAFLFPLFRTPSGILSRSLRVSLLAIRYTSVTTDLLIFFSSYLAGLLGFTFFKLSPFPPTSYHHHHHHPNPPMYPCPRNKSMVLPLFRFLRVVPINGRRQLNLKLQTRAPKGAELQGPVTL